jgi:hypothetical protein
MAFLNFHKTPPSAFLQTSTPVLRKGIGFTGGKRQWEDASIPAKIREDGLTPGIVFSPDQKLS